MSRRLTIIGYHNVEGTHYFDAPAGQGTRGFRQQLQLLRRTMNVVELGTAVRAWAEGSDLPMRSICITFDDGYRDSLDVAAPLLERVLVARHVLSDPGLRVERVARVVGTAVVVRAGCKCFLTALAGPCDPPGRAAVARRPRRRARRRSENAEPQRARARGRGDGRAARARRARRTERTCSSTGTRAGRSFGEGSKSGLIRTATRSSRESRRRSSWTISRVRRSSSRTSSTRRLKGLRTPTASMVTSAMRPSTPFAARDTRTP